MSFYCILAVAGKEVILLKFRGRKIRVFALGLGWIAAITLAGSFAPSLLFAQVTLETPARPSAEQLTRQFVSAAISNSASFTAATDSVKRADLAAGRLLRVQLPRIWKRLKGRFIHPDGSVDLGRVVVLVVLLFLLKRMW